MDYELTLPFTGDSDRVIRKAQSILTSYNFQVIRQEDSCLEVNDALRTSEMKNAKFYGASRIILTATESELHLQVEMGTLRKADRRSRLLFIGCFGIIPPLLLLLFNPGAKNVLTNTAISWAVGLGGYLGIWLILTFFRKKCCRDLETLLKNLSQLG